MASPIKSNFSDAPLYEGDVYLSHLPFPHVMERSYLWLQIYRGTTICFYCGDISKIADDIRLVRPTILLTVPRIL
jgi:long-chain acyl-CoA synthetase